jgi:hypothetical protein
MNEKDSENWRPLFEKCFGGWKHFLFSSVVNKRLNALPLEGRIFRLGLRMSLRTEHYKVKLRGTSSPQFIFSLKRSFFVIFEPKPIKSYRMFEELFCLVALRPNFVPLAICMTETCLFEIVTTSNDRMFIR